MPTTPFLPLPEGLDIAAISETDTGLLVRVTSNRPSSPCPICSTPSTAIHSYYRRHPLDLPCTGRSIRLLLSVRKFFCRVASCPQKIFTERIPELLEPSSRLCSRLRTVIQAIGFAFNGQGGARLAEQLGIHLSRPTFLRSLYRVLTPTVEHIRVVGLDDFAWKRGSRYLKMDTRWHAAPRPKRRSLLDPYRDYLLTRWMEGEHNGNQLTREIRSQGYQGCNTLVREVITSLRKTYPEAEASALPRKHPTLQPSPPLLTLSPKSESPRELRWLLAKKPEELDQVEQAKLSRLFDRSEELRVIYRLLQAFLQMLRQRRAERLDDWMKEARASGIKEVQSFVAGIERDYDAVKAGLRLVWSQGPVEGTVNKLKVHKRLMYGRAGFSLLRQKMLHCSCSLREGKETNFSGSHQKRP